MLQSVPSEMGPSLGDYDIGMGAMQVSEGTRLDLSLR